MPTMPSDCRISRQQPLLTRRTFINVNSVSVVKIDCSLKCNLVAMMSLYKAPFQRNSDVVKAPHIQL